VRATPRARQHPGFRAIAVAPRPPERTVGWAPPRLEVTLGDITLEEVDAVVNAANQSLLGGDGLDGAVHHAAGPGLLEACRRLGGCAIGDAKATRGFWLPARWIIHTVAPSYQGGRSGEAKLLASAYKRSLAVADVLGVRTLAFPALSTGAGGYPVVEATEIAVDTVLSGPTRVELVRFVCHNRRTLDAYEGVLA
jgi:O-acetyl-ADP-ribose deacetylase (regulator of RNase III)